MEKTFEQFRQEKFWKQFNGNKEQADDAYDVWESELDKQEIFDMAQEWYDSLEGIDIVKN